MRGAIFILACFAVAPAAAADLCATRADDIAARLLASKTCAALAATNTSNREALAALMAEDFVMTAASGQFLAHDRAYLIDKWSAPPPPGGEARSSLVEVRSERLDGRAGAISGVIEDVVVSPAGTDCVRHAFTDIWVRRQKRWYWVQSHESGVAPCPAQGLR